MLESDEGGLTLMQDVPIVKIVALGFCQASFYDLGDPRGLIQWVPLAQVRKYQVPPSEDFSGWHVIVRMIKGSGSIKRQLLQEGVPNVYERVDDFGCDRLLRDLVSRVRANGHTKVEGDIIPLNVDGNGHGGVLSLKNNSAIVTRRPMTFVVTDEPSERRLLAHDYRIRVIDSKRAQNEAFCSDLRSGDDLIIGSVQDAALPGMLESLGTERGFRVLYVPPELGLLQVLRERIAPPGRL